MSYKLFDQTISPACEYCEFGLHAKDETMIECKKRGLVSPYFRCKRFHYSPILREPRQIQKLPKYEPEDFTL